MAAVRAATETKQADEYQHSQQRPFKSATSPWFSLHEDASISVALGLSSQSRAKVVTAAQKGSAAFLRAFALLFPPP